MTVKLKAPDARALKQLGNFEMRISVERAVQMYEKCFSQEERDQIKADVISCFNKISTFDVTCSSADYIVPTHDPAKYWYGKEPVAHNFTKETSVYRVYKASHRKIKPAVEWAKVVEDKLKESYGGTPKVNVVVGKHRGAWNTPGTLEGIGLLITGTCFADLNAVAIQKAQATRWKKQVDQKLAYLQLLSSELHKIVPDETNEDET